MVRWPTYPSRLPLAALGVAPQDDSRPSPFGSAQGDARDDVLCTFAYYDHLTTYLRHAGNPPAPQAAGAGRQGDRNISRVAAAQDGACEYRRESSTPVAQPYVPHSSGAQREGTCVRN